MDHFRTIVTDEEGVGVVEIILIVVVLIGLVVIFRDEITKVVNTIFKSITKQVKSIT